MWHLSACLVLLSHPVGAELPSSAEYTRIGECRHAGQYLDLTYQTVPETLPPCVRTCRPGTEAVSQQCVTPKVLAKSLRLRFELRERCRQSTCTWLWSWHLRLKVITVKIAQILGLPAEELQSDVLFWSVPEWPAPVHSPSLTRFLITRRDEANFPDYRRLDDRWYILVMAFRVDTSRVSPSSRGYKIITENRGSNLPKYLGAEFDVENVEVVSSDDRGGDFNSPDFRSVYHFSNMPQNVFPFGSDVDAQAPALDVAQGATCLDPCHEADEQAGSWGPQSCQNDCDCRGARRCDSFGYCAGDVGICYATTTPRLTTVDNFECKYSMGGFRGEGGMRQTSESLAVCAAACEAQPTCGGVEWDRQAQPQSSGKCFLVNTPYKSTLTFPFGASATAGRFVVCLRLSGTSGGPHPLTTVAPSARRPTPSNGCWVAVVSTVSGELGLGASVASCVAADLTTDSCGVSACAVVEAATEAGQCLADLCEQSGALHRWKHWCAEELVVSAFDSAAERSCPKEAPQAIPGPVVVEDVDSGISGGMIALLIVVPLCCCLGVVAAKVLWNRRWHAASTTLKKVPSVDIESAKPPVTAAKTQAAAAPAALAAQKVVYGPDGRLPVNSAYRQGGKAHQDWNPLHTVGATTVTVPRDDFQTWVPPAEMGGRPKEVDRFQRAKALSAVTSADRRRLQATVANMDAATAAAWEAAGVSIGGASSSTATPAIGIRDKMQAPDFAAPSYSNRSTNSTVTPCYSHRSSTTADTGSARSQDTAFTMAYGDPGVARFASGGAPGLDDSHGRRRNASCAWENASSVAEDPLDQSNSSQGLFSNLSASLSKMGFKNQATKPQPAKNPVVDKSASKLSGKGLNGRARGGGSVGDTASGDNAPYDHLRFAAQGPSVGIASASDFNFAAYESKRNSSKGSSSSANAPPPPPAAARSRSVPAQACSRSGDATASHGPAARAGSQGPPTRRVFSSPEPRAQWQRPQPTGNEAKPSTAPARVASSPVRAESFDDADFIDTPELLAVRLNQMRWSTDLAGRRRFFLAQCLRWHPDKNVGDEARATRMFQLLQEKKKWFLAEG